MLAEGTYCFQTLKDIVLHHYQDYVCAVMYVLLAVSVRPVKPQTEFSDSIIKMKIFVPKFHGR